MCRSPSSPGATRTRGRPVDQGATAAIEVWRFEQKGNATWCHSWAVTPVAMLIRYVMGLKPAAPGWTAIRFAPQPVAALEEFESKIRLPNRAQPT
jgi:alpha-L-rhamnosidase